MEVCRICPGQKYIKGQKRDWNAGLKLLCYKMGDSFVKQSGRPNCYYGHLYLQRKAYEVHRNDSGGNADAAAKALVEKQIKDKDLRTKLESGKLPDGQLDMRARRYAVKRFLSWYWVAAYRIHYGQHPEFNSYVQDILGHKDIEPSPVALPPLKA